MPDVGDVRECGALLEGAARDAGRAAAPGARRLPARVPGGRDAGVGRGREVAPRDSPARDALIFDFVEVLVVVVVARAAWQVCRSLSGSAALKNTN